jgi:porin
MPTLPHTSEGVTVSVDLLNDVMFKFCVHHAECGKHTSINDSHFDTQIEKRYLLFGSLPGFVFLGGWYDTTDIELAGNEFTGNYGFSVGIDQTVWQNKPCRHSNGATQRVTFFTQVGTYKKDRSELRFYYDVGLTHRGLLRSRPNDLIGIACTTICFSPEYRTAETLPYKYEAAFECFYKFQVSDNMVLQPDFQYIVHPGGQHADATLLGLVFQIAL